MMEKYPALFYRYAFSGKAKCHACKQKISEGQFIFVFEGNIYHDSCSTNLNGREKLSCIGESKQADEKETAWEVFKKATATATAWETYHKANAIGWGAYEKATAPAWKAYEKAMASASEAAKKQAGEKK